MNSLITGTAAKAADRYAIDVFGIPSLDLMEKASSYVSDYIIKNYQDKEVLIICGSGNNGADGLCIGRMLKGNGFDPLAICCGSGWKGTWEFYRQLSDYRRAGGRIMPAAEAKGSLPDADILVDAVFGIGLGREIKGEYFDIIEQMNTHRGIKISVDVPSGINADTGESMGISFIADRTFTFGRNKTGLDMGEGLRAAGKVTVFDIGIPDQVYEMVSDVCRET